MRLIAYLYQKTQPQPEWDQAGWTIDQCRRGQERYIVDRSATPVVTAFMEEFLLYGSLRGAVRFVERKCGKRIWVSTGRRWPTHPAYRGDLQYGDGQVIRDSAPTCTLCGVIKQQTI
jgi:hypothetical protein